MRTGNDQVRVPPSAGVQKDLCRRTPQRFEGNRPLWKGEGDLPAGLFGKLFSPPSLHLHELSQSASRTSASSARVKQPSPTHTTRAAASDGRPTLCNSTTPAPA